MKAKEKEYSNPENLRTSEMEDITERVRKEGLELKQIVDKFLKTKNPNLEAKGFEKAEYIFEVLMRPAYYKMNHILSNNEIINGLGIKFQLPALRRLKDAWWEVEHLFTTLKVNSQRIKDEKKRLDDLLRTKEFFSIRYGDGVLKHMTSVFYKKRHCRKHYNICSSAVKRFFSKHNIGDWRDGTIRPDGNRYVYLFSVVPNNRDNKLGEGRQKSKVSIVLKKWRKSLNKAQKK